MLSLAEKIAATTFVVVGLYLLLSNPAGTTSLGNSLGGLYTGGVKALQGR